MNQEIHKGDMVIHNTATVNIGTPMEVLDVKNGMVYCKHLLTEDAQLYSADWFPLSEIERKAD